MTHITDAEVAEIQWVSSDEGKAALRAAWNKTRALGLGTRAVDMADIGAIVYAAHLAAEAERPEVRFADFYTASYGDIGSGARALTVETDEPMQIRPCGDRKVIIARA